MTERSIKNATLWEDLLDEQFNPRIVIRVRYSDGMWEDETIRSTSSNHADLMRRFRRALGLAKKEGMPVEKVAGKWQLRPYVIFTDGTWRRMALVNGEWIQCALRAT